MPQTMQADLFRKIAENFLQGGIPDGCLDELSPSESGAIQTERARYQGTVAQHLTPPVARTVATLVLDGSPGAQHRLSEILSGMLGALDTVHAQSSSRDLSAPVIDILLAGLRSTKTDPSIRYQCYAALDQSYREDPHVDGALDQFLRNNRNLVALHRGLEEDHLLLLRRLGGDSTLSRPEKIATPLRESERTEIQEVLKASPYPSVVSGIVEQLFHPYRSVAYFAFRALKERTDLGDHRLRIEEGLWSDLPNTQEVCCRLMTHFREPATDDKVRHLLRTKDSWIRSAAAEYFTGTSDSLTQQTLVSIVTSPGDDTFGRNSCAHVLARCSVPSDLQGQLIRGLKSNYQDVREACATALERSVGELPEHAMIIRTNLEERRQRLQRRSDFGP